MKALILSGGRGTRLRPLTHTSAKQLIPVGGKPILFYGIEAVRNAGIENIGIVIGETGEEIKNSVGDGSKFNVKVTYIFQPKPLGLAHAVKISKDFIGDEPFIVFLGDNLIKDDLKKFREYFEKKKLNSLILLSRVSNPQDFGVAELKNGKVVRLVEKPKNPPSEFALVGVYFFDKNIFNACEEIKPSWRNELEITDAIQWLIDKNLNVDALLIKGWWKDTGKPEDLIEANRFVLEDLEPEIEGKIINSKIIGKVKVEKGAQIIESLIRGPVIIKAGTKIIKSYIGPFTSIQEDCYIENTEIEDSIIMEKSEIKNIKGRIEMSIIGKEVKIFQDHLRPRIHRFILGDHSDVRLIE
ncbi:MAG: glucose-1-phosphate thymidylyltransferase [Candidatus Hydrothermales bacterium]